MASHTGTLHSSVALPSLCRSHHYQSPPWLHSTASATLRNHLRSHRGPRGTRTVRLPLPPP
eukprot:6530077-Lingulodinium_polyedra.AAC.1